MEKQMICKLKSIFDKFVHTIGDGMEYWTARELQDILGYSKWDKFKNVIDKAQISCINSENNADNHFLHTEKMVRIGSGAERKIEDYCLTRYACYLIAMNGDSSKNEIAFAQSYFAVRTRQHEVIEERLKLIQRLQLREQLRETKKRLSQNIYEHGVDDKGFGRIRSKGDKALFGGYTTQDMKNRYGIKSGALADKLLKY